MSLLDTGRKLNLHKRSLAVSKMLCVPQSHAKIYIHGNGEQLLHTMQSQDMIRYIVTEIVDVCSGIKLFWKFYKQ